MRGVEFPIRSQHRQHLRGRRQAQRKPDRQRRGRRDTERKVNEQAQRKPAQDDLRQPEPEDVAAQAPQTTGVKLQSDDEQQQRDPDLGDARHVLGIVDQAEQVRPDEHSANDVAERGAQPELAKQHDEQQRRAEHDRAATEQRAGRLRGLLDLGQRGASIAASSARNGNRIAPWRAVRDRAGASTARPGQLITAMSSPPSQAAMPSIAARASPAVLPRASAPISAADACPKAHASTACETPATRSPSIATATRTLLPQVGERSSIPPSISSNRTTCGIAAARRRMSRV